MAKNKPKEEPTPMKHNKLAGADGVLPSGRIPGAAAKGFRSLSILVLSMLVAGCGESTPGGSRRAGSQRELSYEEVMRLPEKGGWKKVQLRWSDNIGSGSDLHLRPFENGATNDVAKRDCAICTLASQEALERIACEPTEFDWDRGRRFLAIHSITNVDILAKIARDISRKEGRASDDLAAEAACGVLVLGTPRQLYGLWQSLDSEVQHKLVGDLVQTYNSKLRFPPRVQNGLEVLLCGERVGVDSRLIEQLIHSVRKEQLKDIYGETEDHIVKSCAMQEILSYAASPYTGRYAIGLLEQTLVAYPWQEYLESRKNSLAGAFENCSKLDPDLPSRLFRNAKSDYPALVAFEMVEKKEADSVALAKMIAGVEADHPDRAFKAAEILLKGIPYSRKLPDGGDIDLMSILLTPDAAPNLEKIVYDKMVRNRNDDKAKSEFFLRANDIDLRRKAFDAIRDKSVQEQLARTSKEAADWSSEASIRKLYGDLVMQYTRYKDAANSNIGKALDGLVKIEKMKAQNPSGASEAGAYSFGFSIGYFSHMDEQIPYFGLTKTKIEGIGTDAAATATKCRAAGMPEKLAEQFSDLSAQCSEEARYIQSFIDRYNKARR
ncbi:MAG: hypothetical protein IJ783_05740 [Kiritimatiellae bacterium]|nr:hypothetical protein [Kiritimatiellia bacterium]